MWKSRKFWACVGGLLLLSLCLPIWPIQKNNCCWDIFVIDTEVKAEPKPSSEIPKYFRQTHTEWTWYWKSDWCPSTSFHQCFENNADRILNITQRLGF